MPRASTIRKPLTENQCLAQGFCFSDTRFAPHNPYASGSPNLAVYHPRSVVVVHISLENYENQP